MPLYLRRHIFPCGELGLWEISENVDYLLNHSQYSPLEREEYEALPPKRRTQWLAARWLLHEMTGLSNRVIPEKDAYGKPYLPGFPKQISLSHSGDFAGVALADAPVGLDVQRIVGKLSRIEHKFMLATDSERLSAAHRLEHLHVYWGAKEAMYKAYGKRELAFKEHILLSPFDYDAVGGVCQGRVLKGGVDMRFDIHYGIIKEYMVVYAVETKA